MQGILISAKALQPGKDAYLSLAIGDEAERKIESYELKFNDLIAIEVLNPEEKFCCGWYDISAHINHPCPDGSRVDAKYDSCYVCRNRTNFNPAFYHSDQISEQQKTYNQTPHSVYIAYFGSSGNQSLAKAGIMADSRGLTRLYEQGALLYAVVGSFPDAYKAREMEERLIRASLSEAIRKKQKESVLSGRFDQDQELPEFKRILESIGYGNSEIHSNLELFRFGQNLSLEIEPLKSGPPISGKVKAIFGKYLVLENNQRLYGFWLDSLYGREVRISEELSLIPADPIQKSLF